MKRQIVTTIKWDFAAHGASGIPTTLQPPEDTHIPLLFRPILKEIVPKPVRINSLSISSELWRTKHRQCGAIYIEFDRNVFRGSEGEYTKSVGALFQIIGLLNKSATTDGSCGWGPTHCRMNFTLTPEHDGFCEEAVTRGIRVLEAFGINKEHLRSPHISQETYIWFPDVKPGHWKSYGEVVAARCGLTRG